MAQIRIPVYCTNPECGERLPTTTTPTPDERQRGVRRGHVTRVVRTWSAVPRIVQHEMYVELRVSTRNLRCQDCRRLGAIGRPSQEDYETPLDGLHHL